MKNMILFLLTVICFSTTANSQIRTKQEKGYFNITNLAEIQYLRSIDSSAVDNGMAVVKGGFGAHTINGFFINPGMSIGLGMGIQLADMARTYDPGYGDGPDVNIGPDIILMPIFSDLRYYSRNTRNSPMFILDVGYAPLLNGTNTAKDDLNGGALVKLGAGYKIHLSNFISFLPSLNFNAQRFGDNTTLGGSVGIGFMF